MHEKEPMPDAQTKLRAQLLIDVLAGKRTAKAAALALGVSRKLWHAWQRRSLEALLQSLTQQVPERKRPAKHVYRFCNG